MSDLLPWNATPQERALAEAIARISDVDVSGIRAVWNPETCPVNLLPWLAWAFSVDEWSADWSDQQKRDTVRNAIAVQRKKGTIGAVRDALAALGIDVQVQEWFNQSPAAAPYTFKLRMSADQTPVDKSGIAAAIAIVNVTKNIRSHLEEILIIARSETRLYSAAVTNTGNEITVSGYQPGLVALNETSLIIGA